MDALLENLLSQEPWKLVMVGSFLAAYSFKSLIDLLSKPKNPQPSAGTILSSSRIKRELLELQNDPLHNCTVAPIRDGDLYRWEGFIVGPDGSPYQDVVLSLSIEFPENYPLAPMKLSFKTPIYHVNVEPFGTGNIGCPILSNNRSWSPTNSIRSVLQSVLSLLAEPNPHLFVMNQVAAQQYVQDPQGYNDIARHWTMQHAISWDGGEENDVLAAGANQESAQPGERNTVQAPKEPSPNVSKASAQENDAGDSTSALDLTGVSVHHLAGPFMDLVRKEGLTRDSKIYQVENLDGKPGVIRKKGANAISTHDGKLGASYVNSISGDDHVGKADFMLSYTWGYTVGGIIDTLQAFCESNKLDPKRTYIWICCLCVNQHRVVQQKADQKSGMLNASVVDFDAEFRERVVGVGHILAMMAPWHEPAYLSRVWCVFEIYTANANGCNVTIVMPPREMEALAEALVGDSGHIDNLYEALARTRIQDAKASVQSDLHRILHSVRRTVGYRTLNDRVNELLRKWVGGVIRQLVEARTKEISNPSIASDESEQLSFARFCNKVAHVLTRSGEHDEALNLFQTSLEIFLRVNGEDDELTATSYNDIGLVLQSKGEYDKALVEYRKALAIRKSVLGKNHRDTATSYHNIGAVLDSKGEYDAALVEFHEALALYETVLGKDHPDTAGCHHNIGLVLHGKGEHDAALVEYRKALAIHQSALGEAHPATATSYNNIGDVLASKGEYNEALWEYHKALVIRESVLGKDHPDTATTYKSIGAVLYSKGKYDEALAEYRKALVIRELVLGKDHPDTAHSYDAIGEVLRNKGEYDAALVEYHKALVIRESVLGKDHPCTATSYNNIGLVLNNTGKYDEALVEYRKALAIDESVLGKDHRHTAQSYSNVGLALANKGEYDEALAAYRKALEIRESVLGREHPDTAQSYNNIGAVFSTKGENDAALIEYRKALAIHESVLGKDHPSTAISYHNVGIVLASKGEYDAALVEYRKALEIQVTVLGKWHPATATFYSNIGEVLVKKGDYDDALVEYRKVLVIRESVLGKDHKDTAISYINIGTVLYNKGDYNEAQVELLKALKICSAVLGNDHPHTISIRESIMHVIQAQDDIA